MKVRNFTFVSVLISVIFCFSFTSCIQVTDTSEHKADFYVFNVTESPLTAEFVSYEKKSVFKRCRIDNIQPIEEDNPILSKRLEDIAELEDKEKVGYVFSNFIPGTYFVDIDGFSESEEIYPVVYKNGKKIQIENEKAAHMKLKYNSNPTGFFLIVKSKLKLSINSDDYNKVSNDNMDNDEVKAALSSIYYESNDSEHNVRIHGYLVTSSCKKIIQKIRLLEEIPLLVDDDYGYFVFLII
ncbi:MAG: hypothetical protein ACTTHG_00040 [Treponemataceae bacterium]